MKKILKKIFGVIPCLKRFLLADDHYMSSLKLSEILQFGQALKEINKAIELRPGASHYVYQRGLIHFALKKYGLARADFFRVWPDYLDHPEVAANIGFCEKALGKPGAALTFLRLAVSLKEYFSQPDAERKCRIGLVLSYHLLGQPRDALRECDSALGIFPDDLQFLVMKSNIFLKMEHYDKMLEVSKRISELRPDNRQLAELIYGLEDGLYFSSSVHPAGHA